MVAFGAAAPIHDLCAHQKLAFSIDNMGLVNVGSYAEEQHRLLSHQLPLSLLLFMGFVDDIRNIFDGTFGSKVKSGHV